MALEVDRLTRIGIGTWAIGGPWSHGWGSQDDHDSLAAIEKALEYCNWIDTAAVYGFGHSETVVAQALKGRRDKVFLATKCGLVWNEKKKLKFKLNPQSIVEECEASLRRLNTDYIDLYQIHWPDPKTPVEESWKQMIQLQKEGRVRYIGVSNYDANLLEQCEKLGHVFSLQSPYSMVRRDVEKHDIPRCKEHNTKFLAYSPMQAGLLTGKFTKTRVEDLAKDDWRKYNKYFKDPVFTAVMRFLSKLKPIAEKYNSNLAALSVAWVLSKGVYAIVGVRNEDQGEKIREGMNFTLKIEDINTIDSLYQSMVEEHLS